MQRTLEDIVTQVNTIQSTLTIATASLQPIDIIDQAGSGSILIGDTKMHRQNFAHLLEAILSFDLSPITQFLEKETDYIDQTIPDVFVPYYPENWVKPKDFGPGDIIRAAASFTKIVTATTKTGATRAPHEDSMLDALRCDKNRTPEHEFTLLIIDMRSMWQFFLELHANVESIRGRALDDEEITRFLQTFPAYINVLPEQLLNLIYRLKTDFIFVQRFPELLLEEVSISPNDTESESEESLANSNPPYHLTVGIPVLITFTIGSIFVILATLISLDILLPPFSPPDFLDIFSDFEFIAQIFTEVAIIIIPAGVIGLISAGITKFISWLFSEDNSESERMNDQNIAAMRRALAAQLKGSLTDVGAQLKGSGDFPENTRSAIPTTDLTIPLPDEEPGTRPHPFLAGNSRQGSESSLLSASKSVGPSPLPTPELPRRQQQGRKNPFNRLLDTTEKPEEDILDIPIDPISSPNYASLLRVLTNPIPDGSTPVPQVIVTATSPAPTTVSNSPLD